MGSTHDFGELIFNQENNEERRGVQKGRTKLGRGPKVQSG